MEFMRGKVMDFSSNQLGGPIPKLPINLTNLDLSRNNLVGPLPLDFGAPGLETLVLFENSISGTIPSSLCKLQSLTLLDISGNNLMGLVPDCLGNESITNTSLSILALSLRNNNLSGEFPLFLQNCQQLVFLDLSNNHFLGTSPPWIGDTLPSLAFLRLRSNMFYGHIPEELTKLVNLQYLDIACNNLMGSIPKSIVQYQRMSYADGSIPHGLEYGIYVAGNRLVGYTDNFTVVTKGQERLYT